MKVYILEEYANFGEDGITHHIMGVFSTLELATVEVQREHQMLDLTTWGLHDYRLYEVELDKQDAKYSYDDYKTFKFTDVTERTVCLE